MSALLALPLFLASLGVMLAAANYFARRLDVLGERLGIPEALLGLLTAIAADGPEISSALVALVSGAHNASVGVLVGSNVFNLAAMIGVGALLAGAVRLPRRALLIEGLVAVLVTAVAACVLLRVMAPGVAAVAVAIVLVPYGALLIRGRPDGAGRPVNDTAAPTSSSSAAPTHHLAALIVVDVALIIAGSTGMVTAALTLGHRWGIADALLGTLILAPLTSLPNAFTGVRLALARRGGAVVSETFNSNTINLTGGLIVPALFVGVTALSSTGKVDVAWLGAMTLACIALLSRAGGLRRAGAIALIASYVGFVVFQVAS